MTNAVAVRGEVMLPNADDRTGAWQDDMQPFGHIKYAVHLRVSAFRAI